MSERVFEPLPALLSRRSVRGAALALFVAIGACGGDVDATSTGDDDAGVPSDGATTTSDGGTTTTSDGATTTSPGTGGNASAANAPDHEAASDYVWNASDEVAITLDHTTIVADPTRATVKGSVVTITTPGTYRIHGTLDDGQVLVDTSGLVRLVLDGASVTSSKSSPLAVLRADKAIVVLAANAENRLVDAATYVFENGADEPNAALYSKDDLTIYGLGGNLDIRANYNDGVNAKDGLVLKDARLAITAVDDGIRGKSYTVVRGGSIAIASGGDGIKSDEDEDPTEGYVAIESGVVTITAGGDGVQAQTDVVVGGGTVTITAGGGSSATLAADTSAKGLKAGVVMEIDGGNVTVNAADDAVHSDTDGFVGGGTLVLSSGDQGIKVGDTGSLTVRDGTITVVKSREAVSGGTFTLEGGSLRLTASDDGLSISRGTDAMSADDGSRLYLRGGYVVIDATGDGIDVNGSGEMSGGTVIVNGPSANGNGALDVNGTFAVSGGFFVAVGSSGMATAPSTTSTQVSALVNLGASRSAGTLVHLKDATGKELLTFAPAKSYQSVLFTSPALAKGTSYSLYTGGSSTGTAKDGLYSGGAYTAGTLAQDFTTSTTSTVNEVGTSSGGPGRP